MSRIVKKAIRTVKDSVYPLFRRDYRAYDAECRRRLLELGERLGGGSIAIVGNAQSVFDAASGAQIDEADTVIRINRGFIVDAACQGHRTDIVCVAAIAMTSDEIVSQFGKSEIVFVTRRPWNIAHDLRQAHRYPIETWLQLSALIGGERPSAGLLSIDFARNFLRPRSVTLYGFDWKATKTFYAREHKYHVHDWAGEKAVVERWASEGWLALPSHHH